MSKAKPTPSKEYLRNLFSYKDGHLYWRIPAQSRVMGKPAGSVNVHGYTNIYCLNKIYLSHRLIWAYHFGDAGKFDIDHINRDRGDSRIENLRLVTRSQNGLNRNPASINKSGCVGVSWNVNNKCWQAQICINYNQMYLGSSKDFFEACCLRKSAEVGIFN